MSAPTDLSDSERIESQAANIRVLVAENRTAAERIAALEAEVATAWDNWSGFVEPVSNHVVGQPEFQILHEGGPDACAKNVIAFVDRLKTERDAALERAGKAERALRKEREAVAEEASRYARFFSARSSRLNYALLQPQEPDHDR